MPIRVSRAAATTVKFSSAQEIVIDHTNDSIRLGDGTNFITSTDVGGKQGLDVNIINTELDIELDHTDGDSVQLGDGTNTITATTEGSKVGLDINQIETAELTTMTSSTSMGSDFNTSGVLVDSYRSGSIIFTWSGSNSTRPTLVIEVSHDDTNYAELNGSGKQLKDASGTDGWQIKDFDFKYYRLAYTANTATTGSITATLFGKRV